MDFSIPILLYHRVDEEDSMLSTTPATFRKHMQFLSERGWRSLSLDEFTFYAWSGKKLPSCSFFITFDDGYESLHGPAAKILEEFNFRATCFLCTSFIREPATAIDLDNVDNSCFLSWNQARELQQKGLISFQSHTHTHRNFAEMSLADLAADLDAAQGLLSTELRLPRYHFQHLAWPWGKSTEAWRQVASKCGLRYQYTVERQSFTRESALQNMPRTCYDGATAANFQAQFWLQVGPLANVWRNVYPMLRQLRRPTPAATPAVQETVMVSEHDVQDALPEAPKMAAVREPQI